MRVISFCADGIKNAAKEGFYDWIKEQDAEFICIQDLGCAEDDLQADTFFPEGYNAYFFDSADGVRDGVAVYCKTLPKAIMTGLGLGEFDMEGRYMQADYGNISVACLLAPPDGDTDQQAHRKKFLDALKAHLDKIRNKRREFVICGGWHLAHTARDVEDAEAQGGRPGFLDEERQWISEVLDLGYVDAFREVNSDPDEFCWWPDGDRSGGGLRTDFQLVSDSLSYSIDHGAIYKSREFSSHAPVIMDYDIKPVF